MNTNSIERTYSRKQWRHNFIYTSVLGIVGVLSEMPIVMKLVPSKVLLKYSPSTIIILSLLQPVVIVCICAAIGTTLTRRIGFKTILDEMSTTRKRLSVILRSQLAYGVPIGISGAIIAYLVAPTFYCISQLVPASIEDIRRYV